MRPQPVLGNAALGTAIDAAATHLAVYGHAHHGCEHGTTPGGVPVRNVAYPLIRCEARVYHLHLDPDHNVRVATVGHDRVGALMRWSSHRSADLAARTIQHTHATLTAGTGPEEVAAVDDRTLALLGDYADGQYGQVTAEQAATCGADLAELVTAGFAEPVIDGVCRLRAGGHHNFPRLYAAWLRLDRTVPAWQRERWRLRTI